MRAIAIDAFGDRQRLRQMDLPQPGIGPEEVLLRVRAAGVGPWDISAREGRFGDREFPYVPGFEASGTVESVGESGSNLSEGDEVYAYRYPGGCYAEYLAAPARFVARKPASLTFEQAAGVPVAGITAHQGIVDEIGLSPAETVLVTAAAGGVGTFAVQVAASIGARVIGTASPANHDYLRSLGATEAIDYNEGDWVAAVREASGGGVDAVLECAGGETLTRSFDAVRDGGRVAYIVPAEQEPQPPRGISAHFFGGKPDASRLRRLAELFNEGLLAVHLQEVVPLEEASRAHELIEAGHTRGKIVLGIG